MLIQIILIIFIIYAIFRTLFRYKKKEINIKITLIWIAFWIVAGIAVIEPDSTSYLANIVGVGRGVDLVFYVSIIILFFLQFKIFGKLYRLEKDITKIVSHIAVKEAKKRD